MATDDVSDALYETYQRSGLLVRGNDGQAPTTVDAIHHALGDMTLAAPPFAALVENQAPPYSASLLSGACAPLLWYSADYVEAFPSGRGGNPMGQRTIVAAVFRNGCIRVRGACVWDADSNLRNLGSIPASPELNRSIPTSLFAQLAVFGGVAGYAFRAPTSLNNHPLYNPLFRPAGEGGASGADVEAFLQMLGGLRSTWIDALRSLAGDTYGAEFAAYLSSTYQTGLETEVLVEPTEDLAPYEERTFSAGDLECVAFFSDGPQHPDRGRADYVGVKADFLAGAVETWLAPFDEEALPMVSVSGVALPDVPLSGTSSAMSDVGQEWVAYLTSPEFGYAAPLTRGDFRRID